MALPQFKGEEVIFPYTSGEAIGAGDLVRIDSDNGKLWIAVAAETKACLGFALDAATAADESVQVRLCTSDTYILMTLENDYAITQLGVRYALVGGTGAQMVDNNKTDADVFQVIAAEEGGATRLAWVTVIAVGESEA